MPKPWDGQKALHHQDPDITDALGNPLDFISTAGQADVGQADAWLQLTPTGDLLGDKGYDSNAFIQAIHKKGMQTVIPPHSNRIAPRDCGWFVYKKRHLIACFFGKIKHYRRVFSRFDKLARNYMGFFASFRRSFGYDEMSTEPSIYFFSFAASSDSEMTTE